MENKEFIISCDCGCGILKLVKYEMENPVPSDYVLEYYVSAFYENNRGVFHNFWHRIKGAVYLLLGKEFYLYDLLLQEDEFNKFKDFVNSI